MKIIRLDACASTNLEAKRIAESGDLSPVWIQSDVQTGGIGRRGRPWVSQSGNLFCTGLYPYDGALRDAARLSFAAALAVVDTLDRYIAPAHTKIKWPNDVLVDGQKISGILLESGTTNDVLWVAVGVGINLSTAPTDTQTQATCLARYTDTPAVKAVLPILIERFEYWRRLYAFEGFAPLRDAWLERAQGMGGSVTARLPKQTITGVALGMDMDGALEIKTEQDRIIKIHAGDVFFG